MNRGILTGGGSSIGNLLVGYIGYKEPLVLMLGTVFQIATMDDDTLTGFLEIFIGYKIAFILNLPIRS